MRTWLVSILVQLYPRVIDLFSAVLLVDAVQCGEAGEDQSVDQQEKKNMHRHRRFEQFAESAPNEWGCSRYGLVVESESVPTPG